MAEIFYKIMRKINTEIKKVFVNIKYKKHLEKNSKIYIKGKYFIKADRGSKISGNITLGENSFGNNRQTLLRMDENSKIIAKKNFSFFYGCDIILFKGATLTLGNSFINSDAKIRCHKSISIGDGCAISHDFTIMDSNAHYLNGEKKTEPIVIEDNVWIGTRVTILPGVRVGKGSVIAAGAVVTNDVPENCIVGGVPARVLKENITWKE